MPPIATYRIQPGMSQTRFFPRLPFFPVGFLFLPAPLVRRGEEGFFPLPEELRRGLFTGVKGDSCAIIIVSVNNLLLKEMSFQAMDSTCPK